MSSTIQQSDLIRSHFDAVAERYDEFSFLQDTVAIEILERLELLNIEVTHLLELGVGTGNSLESLRKLYPKAKWSLLDSSQAMLDQARKKLSWKQRLFRTVVLQQSSAEATELADESADLVFANLLLPYVKNIDDVFAEVQRVMQPSGVFCFSSFGPDTLKELQAIMPRLSATEHSLQFGQLVDMHILGDILLKAGFREPVMDVQTVTLTFSNFKALWDELRFTGMVMGDDEIQHQVAEFYAEQRGPDGDLTVTFEIVYGQAWANSNQVIRETTELQRAGVFNFPLEQLKRR